jgi:hypothetical protein
MRKKSKNKDYKGKASKEKETVGARKAYFFNLKAFLSTESFLVFFITPCNSSNLYVHELVRVGKGKL